MFENVKHRGAMVEFVNGRRALERKRANYIALAKELDYPVRVFYPAGGFDIKLLTIPSVESLAIVDIVPFLFEAEAHNRRNTYSPVINTFFENNKGRYLDLPELFANPSLTSFHRETMMRDFQGALNNQINRTLDFEVNTATDSRYVAQDNFINLLATFASLGVLDAVEVGKFGDDFKMKCVLDGVEKIITFHNKHIGRKFSEPNSIDYNWVQRWIKDGKDGKTALVVKGDLMRVAQYTVGAVKPDIILGNGPSMNTVMLDVASDYSYISPYNLPFPKERWGYDHAGNIKIGMRERGSSVK